MKKQKIALFLFFQQMTFTLLTIVWAVAADRFLFILIAHYKFSINMDRTKVHNLITTRRN